jgi:F-type H+-transporting ATPase subunit epsilon
MRTFTLQLNGARESARIEDVVSFVGEDASGSFGLRAGHERCMTSLMFGLARYRRADGVWRYLALPGALLYFVENELFINARRFIEDIDYHRISLALTEQLLKEEEVLVGLKQNLRQLEEAMLKQLLNIERGR